jgi:hypothetical protein
MEARASSHAAVNPKGLDLRPDLLDERADVPMSFDALRRWGVASKNSCRFHNN